MTTETSNAREGVGRLVAVLDKAVAKLEVNWPNTAMDVREVRSALLNMAWEIEQHSEGARTACNDRLALRSATAPPPSAPVGVEGVEAALQKWLDWCNEHNEEPEARSGARIAIEALAQQPAADEEAAEQYRKGWEAGHAAAQQPAAVDEVVRAAVLAEREACAKACDDRAAYYHAGDDDGPKTQRGIACEACASVIRWRSTVSPKFLAKHEAGIEERLATQHQEPTT